jgi:hypothetical protein
MLCVYTAYTTVTFGTLFRPFSLSQADGRRLIQANVYLYADSDFGWL